MATKRHKPKEIITKLRQVDVLVGQGQSRIDAIRQVQITEQTYYRWRKQFGGMGTDPLRELKRLQKENERLRRAVSDLTLDNSIWVKLRRETSKPRTVAQLYRLCAAQIRCLRTPRMPGLEAASLDAPLCSKVPRR